MRVDKYSENMIMATEKGKAEQEYWNEKLHGEVAMSNFPKDCRHSELEEINYSIIKRKIPQDVFQRITKLCGGSKYAIYMFLLSGVKYLLYRYTGNQDIIVGMPTFKQEKQGEYVESMLALRTCIKEDETFKNLLGKIRNTVLEVDKNQNFPLDKIAKLLNLEIKGGKYQGLTLVEFDEIHSQGYLDYVDFDFLISFAMSEEGLETKFTYDNNSFTEKIINQIMEHLNNYYETVIGNTDIKLSDIEILSKEEKEKLLFGFNETKQEYPKEKTINQLYEEQVEKTPENIAIVFNGEELTYSQLNKRANQLAMTLREKGVKADTIVGIMVKRSIDMIVGILGVLKAGGAYLPIDPSYPEKRIQYMLEDSGTSVLISHNKLADKTEFTGTILDIQDKTIYENKDENIERINKYNDMAYVIYTSGSTGKPKGVMLEHKGIANLREFFHKDFGINKEDRIIQFASNSFDASVWETFMALLSGATLYIVSEEDINNTDRFEKFLNENKISVVTLPPTYLTNLNPDNINTLKRIITAGSSTTLKLVDKWKDKGVYINAYGPTETTICTTTFECDERIENYNSIPIGKPIYNTRVLILDKNNQLAPIGAAGELCVSGNTLARGYINRPELTAEKFVSNPYIAGERMYRTGDLARWLPDGNVEFLGRIDHQVKIRGYRIEIGEIESQLLEHEKVEEVFIMAREDENHDKYLCAYIVAKENIDIQDLKDYLSNQLPEYMMPTFFIQIDSMPLTPNGKVDRKVLPSPKEGISSQEYVAPRNEIEEKLSNVWAEVLGLERVGIKDNFFELGGDSIKGIQVLSRISKYRLKLELKDIFKHKTIENVSEVVVIGEDLKIEQGSVSGEVQLTPIQNWFFEKQFTSMNHWNQSVMLHGKNGFESEIVKKVFEKIVEQHDALRMVYRISEDEVVQYNRDLDEGEFVKLKVFDLLDNENYSKVVEEEANKLQNSIDLENGPIVKLGLFKTPTGDHLLIVIHHLVIDGVSWRIIFEDFATGYSQLTNEQEISFQSKTHSFKEWSSKLKEFSDSKEIKKEIDYWKMIEDIDIPEIPVDIETKDTSRLKDSQSVEIRLPAKETQKLLTEVNKTYNTEINDILLTTLGLSIKDWSKQDKILVSLEGHGREGIIESMDITRTVGWFTSQYPVLLDMEDSKNISFIIKATKESIRRVPNKGIGYGILKYLSTKGKDVTWFKHNPEISFNYLGQFGQDINTELFNLSELPTGEPMSPESENIYKLNINGIISNGELILSIIYDKNQYEKNTIENLLESYKKNLTNIIDHCTKKDKVEPTPSDVGCKDLSVKQFDKIYDAWGEDIKSIYRLSPTQEGMLFHAVMDTESHTYFQQIMFDMDGYVDVELLEKSFNRIIERHDILRTNFIYKSFKRPLQVVLQRGQIKVAYEDISNLDEVATDKYLEDYKLMDRNKGFDLSKDMLIRLAVIKTDQENYKFIWSFHHILMDGWCLGIINKELFETYIALKNDISVNLEKAPSYRDFIDWLDKQDEEEAKDYWANYLTGYENRAAIPQTSFKDSRNFIREELNFTIDEETTKKLSDIAMKNNTTPNIVLQTIWGLILQRYNNTDDVVFGAVMSGRRSEIKDVEEIVGLFINTVPVRIQCDKNIKFAELLIKMQESALMSEKYSYYPLVEIQETNLLKGALFDHIMVFENYPIEKSLMETSGENDIGFDIVDVEAFQQTNYDFGVTMFPGDDIGVRLTYNRAIYDKELIENIENHINIVASKIIENPDTNVNDIEILSSEENEKIISEFNDTETQYSADKTIRQLFEEQVEKIPNNKAVVFEDSHLTYWELNEKSNQLANLLKNKGVSRNSLVGIMVSPSIEMIIGIFGILKAGGSYLPMDPEFPTDRVSQIIEDSDISIMLTQQSIINEDNGYDIELINLDDEGIYNEDTKNLNIDGDPEDIVYVIYTSGTTGKPKGVQLKNRCLGNYTNWFSDWVDLTSDDKSILVSSFAFDLGYTALYSSLLNGGELHLLRKETYSNPETLVNYIEDNKITYMKATPSLFNMIVNNRGFETSKSSMPLRLVVLGGEQINIEDVEKFHNKYSHVEVINHYGPTETTIGAIANKIDLDNIEEYKKSPVIGKPIYNTEVYILDENLKPVPIGVTGEIHISGDGVAKGYLNRPDITKEKFIENPFSKVKGRMYKTGDLGRYNSDGSIEFLGRKDHQVKIRGYRVELLEIENCLLKQENIKDAIVIAKDDNDGNKYICSYIVYEGDEDSSEVRTKLSKELPDYMIPSFFIALEKLPLNENGKIDRKALPDPQGAMGSNIEYVAPRNEIEEIMVEVWEEVLNVEKIGIDHNFFEMGGHSLKLINLISKVFKEFEVEISPKQVLESPTIREMAVNLSEGNYKEQNPLMLLNKERDKKVFCFPPVGGYGLVYKNLADISEEYSYYSFNYIDDSGNNLSMYIDYITEVQAEGPYVLMGWSAGGNLAFEVAKEMEKQGLEVSDIILADVHRMTMNMDMPKEEIQEMVEKNLTLAEQDEFYKDYLTQNTFMRNRIASKMEDFFTYLRNDMINSGDVNFNIHNILSTDEVPEERDLRGDWHKVTTGKFEIHQGAGSHPYMLYAGAVEENERIIRKIYEGIFTRA